MTEEIINVEELKHFLLELEKVIDCKNGTIETLKQENKALQAYKDINEDFKQAWYELNEKYKQLRSALEEIKHILEIHKDELEECLHNDIDGIIQNKINEVLN